MAKNHAWFSTAQFYDRGHCCKCLSQKANKGAHAQEQNEPRETNKRTEITTTAMSEAPRGETTPGHRTPPPGQRDRAELKVSHAHIRRLLFLNRRTMGSAHLLLCLFDTATKFMCHISSIWHLSLHPHPQSSCAIFFNMTTFSSSPYDKSCQGGWVKTNSTYLLVGTALCPFGHLCQNVTTLSFMVTQPSIHHDVSNSHVKLYTRSNLTR